MLPLNSIIVPLPYNIAKFNYSNKKKFSAIGGNAEFSIGETLNGFFCKGRYVGDEYRFRGSRDLRFQIYDLRLKKFVLDSFMVLSVKNGSGFKD